MKNTSQNLGHRARVKEKFLNSFGAELHDYELLEIMLFSSFPRKDSKPLAKKLINKFGDISAVLNASENMLRNIEGVSDSVMVQLKLAAEVSKRILKKSVQKKSLLNNFDLLVSYVSSLLQDLNHEVFYVLFLDKKYHLIEEQLISKGESDFILVSAKDVARRALILHSSAIVLAHNHPSGDLKPSNSDIKTTNEIIGVLSKLQIQVLDHLIIAKTGNFSFKENALL